MSSFSSTGVNVAIQTPTSCPTGMWPLEAVADIRDLDFVRALRAELGDEFFAQLRDLARAGKSVMDALDGRHEARALEVTEVVDELKEIASTLQ